MNKKVYIFTSIYSILTASDIIVTFLSTPDLMFEDNPLVTALGLGWNSLLLANIIGMVIYVFCCYYCFEQYQTITCDVKNIGEYVSHLAFNRKDKFLWIFYKVPENWNPIFACLSYEIIWAFILARCLTLFEWYVWHSDTAFKINYVNFKHSFAFGRLDLVIVMAAAFYLVSHWFFKEYAKCEKKKALCLSE